jgi:dTDP-D-glucose 4,6-dehydratase
MVSGGLGFIRPEFVRRELAAELPVINWDLNMYTGGLRRIGDVHNKRLACAEADVADPDIRLPFERHRPELVFHFAAGTHVTRSDSGGCELFRSNVEATWGLGWSPVKSPTHGLGKTVRWYRENESWRQPLVTEAETLYADTAVAP